VTRTVSPAEANLKTLKTCALRSQPDSDLEQPASASEKSLPVKKVCTEESALTQQDSDLEQPASASEV
jgi:hypothetical protein